MILLNKIIVLALPLLPKSIVKVFSNRYVAGTNYKQALKAIADLNQNNQLATIDILGEHTENKKESIKI